MFLAIDNTDVIAPVIYTPGWLSAPVDAFQSLWEQLAWKRIGTTPRREYYSNDISTPYTYGMAEFARTYEPQPWHPVMRDIQSKLEAQFACKFEVCFLNGYENGQDQLGWHADDSPEMDDERPIAIVSLYPTLDAKKEREIWFKMQPKRAEMLVQVFTNCGCDPKQIEDFIGNASNVTKMKLGNGSLALMPAGMQDRWFHRIPKSGIQDCGARISLTFRGYVA